MEDLSTQDMIDVMEEVGFIVLTFDDDFGNDEEDDTLPDLEDQPDWEEDDDWDDEDDEEWRDEEPEGLDEDDEDDLPI